MGPELPAIFVEEAILSGEEMENYIFL